MSLRRRITGAVAIGVAAVVLVLAAVVYVSVRSHLRSEIDRALITRATQQADQINAQVNGAPFGIGGPGPGGPPMLRGPHRFKTGPADPYGGAPGYIQLVDASGASLGQAGGTGAAAGHQADHRSRAQRQRACVRRSDRQRRAPARVCDGGTRAAPRGR